MPLEVALDGARIIAEAVDLPVSADLDDGYDDPGETTRRAIGFGIAGANIEDRLRPFDEAVARVAAVTRAAEREGVAFQLNARTDVFADRPQQISVYSGDQMVDTFPAGSGTPTLKRIPITAAQLGTNEMAELRIEVDRTFVPAKLPAGGKDVRELGVRVYNVFVETR